MRKVEKVLTVFTIGAFFVAFLPIGAYGQAEVSPSAGTSMVRSDVGVERIKQTLPKAGNVSVNFKDVDIKTVLHYLSEVSGVDIIPSPGVDAMVTMRLRDKPWKVALDIVTRNYGYVYSSDDETSIIRVIPKNVLQGEETITTVIPLNYIIQDAILVKEERELDLEKRTDNITKLLESINASLVEGEKATYSSDSNSIIITAIPSRVSTVKEVLSKLDRETPQIMLDAKVIEVTLDRNDQFGVDWNAVVTAAGARRPTTLPFESNGKFGFLPGEQGKFFPDTAIQFVDDDGYTPTTNSNFPYIDGIVYPDPSAAATASSIFTYGTLDFSQFQATLRMLDERDDTRILSSPRITTLNNQTATIKVVTNIFLQESQASTDSAAIITVQYEEDPREVGVILEVTPHVNAKEEIMVSLRPEVSSNITFTELSITEGTDTVSMQYNSRIADTQILVEDGQTIFIGGLISQTTTKEDHKLPILGDLLGWVPILGGAVKYEQDNVDKTEVVFFVTVHLIKNARRTITAAGPEVKKQYDDYFKEEAEKNKTEVKTGKVKVVEQTATVPVKKASAAGKVKKKSKPFLDFRKKS